MNNVESEDQATWMAEQVRELIIAQIGPLYELADKARNMPFSATVCLEDWVVGNDREQLLASATRIASYATRDITKQYLLGEQVPVGLKVQAVTYTSETTPTRVEYTINLLFSPANPMGIKPKWRIEGDTRGCIFDSFSSALNSELDEAMFRGRHPRPILGFIGKNKKNLFPQDITPQYTDPEEGLFIVSGSSRVELDRAFVVVVGDFSQVTVLGRRSKVFVLSNNSRVSVHGDFTAGLICGTPTSLYVEGRSCSFTFAGREP